MQKKAILFGNNIPTGLTELFGVKYRIFSKKAVDLGNTSRKNDTELKYIFNLLENHWDDGDHFVITLESTLYTCESCQGYLVYLKSIAKKANKTIEIKVISHSKAKNTDELFN